MKNIIKMSLATAIMVSVGTLNAQAAEDGISIFDNIKVKGEIRPRYEMVDESNPKPNANALTNRLMLGVNADLFGTDWLSTYVEMTDVHSLNNNYNGLDGKGQANSIVADPEQTRLTQSYLDLKYKKTLLRAGRQMVNLDNQRFIGAVGWRQMPQTFDAVAIVDNSIENLNFMAAYVTQVNTIFADGGPKTNSASTETVLLNAKYKVMDALSVTGYGYLVEDFGDTYGLALTGSPKISDGLTLNYRAEYAMLGDASFETSGTNTDNDADYMNVELGVNMSGILAEVGYEVQSGTSAGSTSNDTFSTPLGTNHGHNGWADLFLATPTEGLVDMDIMVGYKSKDLGLVKAIYHDFTSDVESIDYGTELDLLYKRAIPGVNGLTGMLKYADYSADDFGVDTQKFWAMLDYKFSN
ncbi:MAG: hypothetical protein COA44_07320 [Arcobacter sp.]|nr:MAG: hypothetical protein COA44_07320 [Arcobacter sp.]